MNIFSTLTIVRCNFFLYHPLDSCCMFGSDILEIRVPSSRFLANYWQVGNGPANEHPLGMFIPNHDSNHLSWDRIL